MSGESNGQWRRRRWLAVSGPLAIAVLLGACGSSKNPVSNPASTTTAVSSTTTAPASTTTAAPASTTTTTAPAGTTKKKPSALAQKYLAIVTAADAANQKLADPLENYVEGKETAAQFRVVIDTYLGASTTFQHHLRAVKWPGAVESDVQRLIAKDRQLTALLKKLPGEKGTALKNQLNQINTVLVDLKALSNAARSALGLPQNA